MALTYEIRLSGEGGQGLILAGIILGRAASVYGGKNAVQTQSYGPEARGGASKSEVIISDEEIDYPRVQKADLLLAFTQESLEKYLEDVKKEGIILLDSDGVLDTSPAKGYKVFSIPFLRTATEEIGRTIVANMIALGAVSEVIKDIVKPEDIEKAIKESVPRGTEELNLRAFKKGRELYASAVNSVSA